MESDEFIEQMKAAGEWIQCPKLGGMLRAQCAARFTRRKQVRSFGRKLDLYVTPQDNFCRQCPVGRGHARRLAEEAAEQARGSAGGKRHRRDVRPAK